MRVVVAEDADETGAGRGVVLREAELQLPRREDLIPEPLGGVGRLGFGGADVDSVLENNLNIAPQGDYLFAAASTGTISVISYLPGYSFAE